MSFLGIDLGTSFLKGAVLDLEKRRILHVRRKPFPEPLPTGDPLRCEFDPQAIVSEFRALVDELSPLAPDCEGVVVCTQMHGVVLVNENQKPVSNCVTWRDQRTLASHPSGSGTYFDLILSRISAQERQQLGNELQPARPLCFLFWSAEQGKLAPSWIPASLPDFILSSICDEAPGVEATNASAYGAFNLETSDWHHDVIGKLGLQQLRWPAIRRQGEVAGHVKLGAKRVPCYAPVGDAQAALAGSLLSPEELSLNIATGAQVSRLSRTLSPGSHQTRPYFDGQFLHTFSNPPAGREINVLIEFLTELARGQTISLDDPWPYIADAVTRVEDTDLSVDLNFFSGGEAHRGNIANISAENLSVGHLFRAAFRSMAAEYYQCATILWPDAGWKNLVLSGGLACKVQPLRDEIQKRFGAKIRVSAEAEDTLFGLLILASVFSGRAKSVEDVSRQLRSSLKG